jgi:dual specificity phosphatase 12
LIKQPCLLVHLADFLSALPLFEPTLNFTRALSMFAACKFNPTVDHPAMVAHKVATVGLPTFQPPADSGTNLQAAVVQNAEVLTRTAAAIMSETGIDMSAFGDALAAIQQKASLAHSTSAAVVG